MFRRRKSHLLAVFFMSAVGLAQRGNQQPESQPVSAATTNERQNVDSDKFRLLKPPLREEYESEFLPPGADPHNELVWPFLKHLASDQKQFWTAPKKIFNGGAPEFISFAGATGLLIGADSWISRQVPDKPGQLDRSLKISNYGVYTLGGLTGAAFVWGHFTKNDRLRETGLLAGEAAVNSVAVTTLLKGITQRPRPSSLGGGGGFFAGGDSFPSDHSALSWSIASVIAHEYPGPLTKLLTYGLASTVMLTRVTSKQHFASDAVVGSVLGWYFGRQVYRAHHDSDLGGAAWGGLREKIESERSRDPASMGSPIVPPDSWVYPLFERLAGLGYVRSAYLGTRPWTRMECARLVEEAGDAISDNGEDGGDGAIYRALANEFKDEIGRLGGAPNLGASVDSIYTRLTNISGTPLRDGYHFGQTIINDFGRPYGEGVNAIAGFSAHAVAGPFSFYVDAEYQNAPATTAYSPSVQQAIADADLTTPVSNASAAVSRLRLREATAGITLRNVQISFGKQSLWLGPGETGSLLFSTNAEPVMMLKIESASPLQIPLLSRIFGPAHTEFFLGQLGGHEFEINGTTLLGPGDIDPQPYIHGSKISFRPTDNLEFGMGFTAQFGGPGLPFTWDNFIRTFYVHNETGPTSSNANPAKRISAFDFTYRIPGVRNWLTFYNEAMVVDEFSPLGSSRPTLSPGIYLTHFPKLPKLDFRAEGLHESITNEFAPGFVYYGLRRYRSGYTNDGQLLGNWIGRAGRGGQGWLTYWLSPQNKIQLSYRQQMVSKDFLGGGRLCDYSITSEFLPRPEVGVSGSLQYEKWRFPVLSATPQSNLALSFQIAFYPRWKLRK